MQGNFRPIEAVMLMVIRKQLVVSREECILKTGESEHHFTKSTQGSEKSNRDAG